jgi:hypothetical protein
LLAVIQVLMRMWYDDEGMYRIFGGREAMIESPLLEEFRAEIQQKGIQQVLEVRFGTVPSEVFTSLQPFQDEEQLTNLLRQASVCSSLEAFRTFVSSLTPQQ